LTNTGRCGCQVRRILGETVLGDKKGAAFIGHQRVYQIGRGFGLFQMARQKEQQGGERQQDRNRVDEPGGH
jgi:hypothetical protein